MADPRDWQPYVHHAARLAGLRLDEAREAAVTAHFARLAEPAQALLAFELAESDEPAPVYRPDPEQP